MTEIFVATAMMIVIKFLTGESPLDDAAARGDERPLDQKLPYTSFVRSPSGIIVRLTGAKEIHRLAVEDFHQLERRSEEIRAPITDSTCSLDGILNVNSYSYSNAITPLWLACFCQVWDSALLPYRIAICINFQKVSLPDI